MERHRCRENNLDRNQDIRYHIDMRSIQQGRRRERGRLATLTLNDSDRSLVFFNYFLNLSLPLGPLAQGMVARVIGEGHVRKSTSERGCRATLTLTALDKQVASLKYFLNLSFPLKPLIFSGGGQPLIGERRAREVR
jgi:hypothetical protein